MGTSHKKGAGMEFLPAVAMMALIVKVIDFGRYARAGDINGVVTQLVAWAAGVIVLLLVSRTTWADGITVGDRALSTLNFWSVFFAGISISSAASLVKDTLKSVDNHNSSAIPTLLPSGPHRARRGEPAREGDVG
jgi:hypothetical protein